MTYVLRWPLLGAVSIVVGGAVAARAYLYEQIHVIAADQAVMLGIAQQAVWLVVGSSLIAIAVSTMTLEYHRRRTVHELALSLAELHRRNERELEQRRLVWLGTLSAGLAHELGQPLSSAQVDIDGLHLIRQCGREPTPDHIQQIFHRMKQNITAMSLTVEHLRSLASPGRSLPLHILDLTELIDRLLAERDQWLSLTNAVILWNRPLNRIAVLGDAAGIRLIAMNLIRNACEAVVDKQANLREIRVGVGPGSVLTVSDQGPGISEEHMSQLFDPFFTTKSGGSHGIGLSLARASAERMRAELLVESKPDQGSTFSLRLLAPTTTPEHVGGGRPPP